MQTRWDGVKYNTNSFGPEQTQEKLRWQLHKLAAAGVCMQYVLDSVFTQLWLDKTSFYSGRRTLT